MQTLLPDLLLLRSDEPSGLPAANAYAIVAGERVLLVDAVHRSQLEQVREIIASGRRVAGMLITHRHVVAQANGLRALHAELRIPIYLHPLDAAHRQARAVDIPFHDPCAPDGLPHGFGVEPLLFPGHTAGHVMLYWAAHGGVLLCGDCARGGEGEAGAALAMRTPPLFSEDDARLSRSWAAFHRPVAALCPLSGRPVMGRADALALALQTLHAPVPV
ncbi:MAG TPA: MBL fold metallo-hydrolase [Longimicrobium sp.]|nr:MBL fold metallo-hydrolase [Longimicrobium sp.]